MTRRAGSDRHRGTAGWSFARALGLVLALGLLYRVGYLLAQPASDPTFAQPMLDGQAYLEWARAIVAGSSYDGAFYRAPLYPYLLAALLRLGGESFGLVYLLQHLLAAGTAAGLALVARRAAGDFAGLATAALFLLYQPLVFFASRPLGETLALALLALSLWLVERPGARAAAGAGWVGGVAALARPNLLLVPLVWAVTELAARRGRRAALLVVGLALAILPVTLRNHSASGHAVPISANSGMTAYHGNGPGAAGIFTVYPGFSGSPLTQRAEATALARELSGLELDAVDADRFWGRAALSERLKRPGNTLSLLATRALLLLDNYEHGLDYAPMLDRNRLRPTWRFPREAELAWVPFALLFGLAAAGFWRRGWRGTGGAPLWGALLASALAPLLFYVSCRYRLPAAALLTVPAGCGLAALLGFAESDDRRGRRGALLVALACAALALLVPSQRFRTAERAAALSNLSSAYKAVGDLAAAEREGRLAAETDPSSARAWYNLGVVLDATGRHEEAARVYDRTLELDPGFAEAAANRAKQLVEQGRPARAVPLLRAALERRPAHAECWANLVVALAATGEIDAARQAAREAAGRGVSLDPGLLEALDAVGAELEGGVR